jgi:hypothetical protein
MLMIPIQTPGNREDALVIVLDDANIERMKKADPAEIPLPGCGKHLVNPQILVAYEKDHATLNRFIQRNDLAGLIEHIQRGFTFQPEKGDHDRGPESIHGTN